MHSFDLIFPKGSGNFTCKLFQEDLIPEMAYMNLNKDTFGQKLREKLLQNDFKFCFNSPPPLHSLLKTPVTQNSLISKNPISPLSNLSILTGQKYYRIKI